MLAIMKALFYNRKENLSGRFARRMETGGKTMQAKLRKPISVLLSLVMLLSVFAGLNVLPAAQADAPAYLTFTGTDSFSIRANSKGWDGTL